MEEKTKLNMQMYDAESILAPLQKLNLMDDFLFEDHYRTVTGHQDP